MAEVYIYRPDCQDFSTIGECGRMDASLCDCEMVANGLIEITLEHPIDRLGRYRLLQENWILKTEIPVLTTPEIEGGAYVTSVERWTVSPGATKAQRTVWSKASGGRKKKVLKANSAVTVTSAPATGSRYKVKTGKVTGWMESAALVNKVTETIPATATGIEQAVPSWELREQTFRIYHVDQTDRKVTAYAKARSYDLAYNLTTYNTDGAVSLQAALDGIFGNTLDSHEAEAYTDISGTRVGVHARDMNPIQALLDPENGLCARWNAQLVRDEMDFFLLAHAGRDRGLRIEFARNLAGIHMSTNIDDVFTHVRPIGETKAGGPLYLASNQGLMACPKAASYPFKRIYPLKVSEAKVDKQVSTALARTRMTQAAQALIDTGIDEPDVDAKIAFERLGDSPRYQQYRALKDRAFLYDTIAIHHPVLGIDISAQVCRLKWDCLREKTKDMDIGSLAKLAPSVSSWQLSGNINGSKLADGTVGGVALVDGAVDVRHLQAESVNADAMQTNSFTANTAFVAAMNAHALDAVTAHIGALTSETITTDNLVASIAQMLQVTAGNISAQGIQTDALAAQLAQITVLAAGTGSFDRATVQHLVSNAMNLTFGTLNDVFIENLRVAYAQMVSAAIGNLCVKASDGNYYTIDVAANGNVTATPTTVTSAEEQAGQTNAGRVILETDITAANLSTSNLLATYALVNKIDAARIDVDQLFARQAFIDELNTSVIQSPDFVNIVVGAMPAKLEIDSSRGNVFKVNTAYTELRVSVHYGPRIIENLTDLHDALGNSAHLQWEYLGVDDTTWGTILANDPMLSYGGFTLTVTPNKVATKVTFRCKLMVE